MLGVLNRSAIPRRFQGSAYPLQPSLRGWRGLGDDFTNLTGVNTADQVTTYTPPVVDQNPCDFNFCTTPSTVNASGSGGGSTASIIAGFVGALAPIGAILAKNLTTPYSTTAYNPATGQYYSSTPAGTVAAGANPSLAALTGSLQGMLPLLLIGGLGIMFVSAMSHK